MKALKLIIIAIIMAGALGGLMFLSLGGDSEEKSTPEQEALYSKLKTKIEDHWDDGGWSLSKYNDDYIMLNKQKDELGRQYFTSLSDQLNTVGNRALYQDLKAAYTRPTCKRTDIEPFMSDMDRFLQKAPGFDKDKLIKEMQATYTLYNQVLALATTNFTRTPSFNITSNSFTPLFHTFKNTQLQLVRDIRGSEYFGNIERINEVNEALNSVPSRLDEAENVFMNKLANLIVNAYETDTLSDRRSRFVSIRKKYNDEFNPKSNSRIELYLRSLPLSD